MPWPRPAVRARPQLRPPLRRWPAKPRPARRGGCALRRRPTAWATLQPGAAATIGRVGDGETASRLGGGAAASPGSRASAVRDARLRCGVRLARGLELSARLAPLAGRAGEVASAGGSCRTGVTAGLRPSACSLSRGCCPASGGSSDANASCGAVALRGVPSAGPASATAHQQRDYKGGLRTGCLT